MRLFFFFFAISSKFVHPFHRDFFFTFLSMNQQTNFAISYLGVLTYSQLLACFTLTMSKAGNQAWLSQSNICRAAKVYLMLKQFMNKIKNQINLQMKRKQTMITSNPTKYTLIKNEFLWWKQKS